MEIRFEKTEHPMEKPDQKNLGFGKHFTDYMFVMDWDREQGWHDARIVPYAPIAMDPATMVLHYAQETFEGLKAYRTAEGKIQLFRPEMNAKRMIRSNERLCMPAFPVDMFVEAIEELVKVERDWVPSEPETSLYIRPFMFANEEVLGVHASHKYTFCIILSPVGSYYAHGLEPTKILVEEQLVRAFIGGTGEAKCSGNYACSLMGGEIANAKGYDQALWLDGKEHKYVEEVGSMNIFFVIGDEVVTPALVGSILPGITRNSCIQVLKKYGYNVSERRISMDEIVKAYEDGTLKESFGSGTAAVISPVGVIGYRGKDMIVGGGKMGEITAFLYDKITGIQQEKYPDEFGWVTEVK